MAGSFENLRPNRELLNPKFDGYKLSSEQLAVESTALPNAVNIVGLRDDVFSHLHVKAFAWTNHLVLDNWSQDTDKILLYIVDESHAVHQIVVQVFKKLQFRRKQLERCVIIKFLPKFILIASSATCIRHTHVLCCTT